VTCSLGDNVPSHCMSSSPKLIFFCGKMAAGKSTLARELACGENAVLFVQDDLMAALFPGEITDIPTFVDRYARLKYEIAPIVCDVLSRGTSVVLDFAANTRTQRTWFRELIDRTQVAHELHYVEASDELCKRQLRERSKDMADGSRWTTAAEFDAVTA